MSKYSSERVEYIRKLNQAFKTIEIKRKARPKESKQIAIDFILDNFSYYTLAYAVFEHVLKLSNVNKKIEGEKQLMEIAKNLSCNQLEIDIFESFLNSNSGRAFEHSLTRLYI